MSVQPTDLSRIHSAIRLLTGDESSNGGRAAFPVQKFESGVPGSYWPAVLQRELTDGIQFVQKTFLHCTPTDNSALADPKFSFFDLLKLQNVVDPNAYSYWWMGTHDDTGADNGESTADKYGIGELTTEVVAGTTQSFSVDFYHTDLIDEALAGGDDAVIKTGYYGVLEARDTGGGSGNYEIIGPITVTGVTDTTVTFTTASAATLSYAIGDRFCTLPTDLDDLLATVNSIDKTGLTGGASTFDETGVEVYSTVPRMDLTLTIEAGALTYSASCDVTGWSSGGSMGGGYSISADKTFTNEDPTYPRDIIKIPANAFNGTLTAGDVVILEIYPSMLPTWQRVVIEAGAASGTRTLKTLDTGETV